MDQQESFLIVGGANPDEEAKESESVIFFRNRPHYDRYFEEDLDDDPEEGVRSTSSFVYFSEDEEEEDGRPRSVLPAYLRPNEFGHNSSNLVPPASFDISEPSTIIVREDQDARSQRRASYDYPKASGDQRDSSRSTIRIRPSNGESQPVEFDQTVVVVHDSTRSPSVMEPASLPTRPPPVPTDVAVERSRLEDRNNSIVDEKPSKQCGWILLLVAFGLLMLGGGGGAALYLSGVFEESDITVATVSDKTMDSMIPSTTPSANPMVAPTPSPIKNTVSPVMAQAPIPTTPTGMPVGTPVFPSVMSPSNRPIDVPVLFQPTAEMPSITASPSATPHDSLMPVNYTETAPAFLPDRSEVPEQNESNLQAAISNATPP